MTKRRVIIAHGWNDGGNNVWINWLSEELKRRRYEVIQPVFPHIHIPRPVEWVEALREAAGTLDANTVIVGYSLGVPTVMRFLNDYPYDVKIAGLVLIAGFGDGMNGRPSALFDPPLDYERLKRRTAHRVCIYSDNDYLVAPKYSQQLALALDAREVIVVGGGHLTGLPVLPGSVKQLPAVLDAIKDSYHSRVHHGWRQAVHAVRKLLGRVG